ncbi:dipeptide epimerase [Adhaeribacter aquaticus]|uniref:dipeptide epimerase n=1 Tax=Adhaeribacter aquaticus TaxID=299567 RepID=UPI000413205A|nr:dipeptide epimerase [Adhaeribacter aquaticus]
MLRWHIEAKPLQLRYTWKISRNSSDIKTNLFIRVADRKHVGIGEAAPNIRYNETAENLTEQFDNLIDHGLELIRSLEDLQILLSLYPPANAIRFAIESAYIHYICQQKGLSVGDFLGINIPASVATSFSLPIMNPETVADFIKTNHLNRFASIKVKVNEEEGLDLIKQVAGVCHRPLIIDANEAWTDPEKLLVFLEKLKQYNIAFVEQPMPASSTDEYVHLHKHSPYNLFADESVTNQIEVEVLKKQFHGVNMKLMKAGGYLNGLRILEQAKAAGLKTMVGCMVETSLGIWSAMQLCEGVYQADLDGFLILKEEPFGIVQELGGRLYMS